MAKFITVEEAVRLIPDGASILYGGFLGCGSPHRLIDALARSGKSGFTMIGNDGGMEQGPEGGPYGVAKLIHNRQVSKLIVGHIGVNPEVGRQMAAGSLEVTLVPEGSLAEMIRAGGAGLGGVLTPVGVGTLVEQMEHVAGSIEIDGRKYLIERPIRADIAIINGYQIDRAGNIWYRGTTRTFNPMMATAADLVIAEADQVVEIGAIRPEDVVTQGVLVDYVIDGGQA